MRTTININHEESISMPNNEEDSSMPNNEEFNNSNPTTTDDTPISNSSNPFGDVVNNQSAAEPSAPAEDSSTQAESETKNAAEQEEPLHAGDAVYAGSYDENDTYDETGGSSTQAIFNYRRQILDIDQQIQATGKYVGPKYNEATGTMEMTEMTKKEALKYRRQIQLESEQMLNIPWSDRHHRGFKALLASIIRAIKYRFNALYRRTVDEALANGVEPMDKIFDKMYNDYMNKAQAEQAEKTQQQEKEKSPTKQSEEHQQSAPENKDKESTQDQSSVVKGFEGKDEFNANRAEPAPENAPEKPEKKPTPRQEFAQQLAQQLIAIPPEHRLVEVQKMALALEGQIPYQSKKEITPGKRQAKAIMDILKPAMQQDPSLGQVFVDCMMASHPIKEKEQKLNLQNYLSSLAITQPQVFQYLKPDMLFDKDNKQFGPVNLDHIISNISQDIERKPSLSAQAIFEKFAAMPESADRQSIVGRLLDKGIETFGLDINALDAATIPAPDGATIPTPDGFGQPVQPDMQPVQLEFADGSQEAYDPGGFGPANDIPDFEIAPDENFADAETFQNANANIWEQAYTAVNHKVNDLGQLSETQSASVTAWVLAAQQPEQALNVLASMTYTDDELVSTKDAHQILALLMFSDASAMGENVNFERASDALMSTIYSYADERILQDYINDIISVCSSTANNLAELQPQQSFDTAAKLQMQYNLLQNAKDTHIDKSALDFLANAIDHNSRQVIQEHNKHHSEHPWPVGKLTVDENGELAIQKKGVSYSVNMLVEQDSPAAHTQDIQQF